jgi:single-stranded-DNA-specific exonuclease
MHAIDALKEEGVSLIITVDSGITNIEEVAYAKKKKVDFIITDHHLPVHDGEKQIVPDAVAVINSKQDTCTYHDDMLCGCAVAWKLSCALLTSLREAKSKKGDSNLFIQVLERVKGLPIGWEKWLLDLVGISTIADLVPLRKENRALAHFGLTVLRRSPRPGLKKLFTLARSTQTELVEDDIAFTIAPRVNAASRMDTPMLAHTMLFEKDFKKASSAAEVIETLNTQRKSEVKDVVSTLHIDFSFDDDVIVVGDVSWSPGVIGLIAQNILDRTGKSVFVWGKGEDVSDDTRKDKEAVKGSCRSKGDVHVVDLMRACGDVFTHIGGHEQAGGFSTKRSNVEAMKEKLNEVIKTIDRKEISDGEMMVDTILSLSDVHYDTYKEMSKLAPFGVGNPKPLFAFQNVVAKEIKSFGKEKNHLEVIYEDEKGKRVKAISFSTTEKDLPYVQESHTLLAHIEKSTFGGRTELRLRIKDIVPPALLY